MLRLALEVADRIVSVLPSGAAYALADFAGDLWYRLAPERRRLVAANLARVCAATGRPTRGPEFAALVHSAFRNHARYYVELLRAPHYPIDRIDEHVEVPDWDRFLPLLQDGPAMLLSSHLGNFEPFGTVIAAHGMRPLSPVEEIEPRALYEFVSARRGASQVDLVPLGEAARAIVKRLRSGGIVGIIADRDLAGDGQPVTMFGHPDDALPPGPAALAVAHRANLIVGRCLRVGSRPVHRRGGHPRPAEQRRPASRHASARRADCRDVRARHRRGTGAVVGRLPAVLAGPAAMTRNGGELGKADMHLHTLYSDGTASVRAILDHVERATDLDLIAITDHERIDGAPARRRDPRRRRLLVRPGHRRGDHDPSRPPPRALRQRADPGASAAGGDDRARP